ncbi:MAG: phosphoribosylglycinamide formyltransferase [Candidatus Glassbacteria bacterium]|nr:phosphoribosylglycinamide formyltransferase [Candidatus Glassbacteria bacterium]
MSDAGETQKLRVAVMASGGGTNLQKLLDRFPDRNSSSAHARVVLVVTDRPGAGSLDRATKAGVATEIVPPADFDSQEGFGRRLLELFEERGVGLVVLAGYLKMVPPNVVAVYSNRMINIHPALLPSFGGRGMYGRRVHEAVIASGAKLSGPTVHFINEEYDRGPIIAQSAVPVFHEDTPEELAARVLEKEHELLPEVVGLIASGRVEVVEGRVKLREE